MKSIFGRTGSGKTLVMLQLVKEAQDKGSRVIVLTDTVIRETDRRLKALGGNIDDTKLQYIPTMLDFPALFKLLLELPEYPNVKTSVFIDHPLDSKFQKVVDDLVIPLEKHLNMEFCFTKQLADTNSASVVVTETDGVGTSVAKTLIYDKDAIKELVSLIY
ncbi:ATP-binding protein [Bacillus subtilis]|uniref:ATP-binding protein n=1 Tax=Bacillus subtilis TaxID=1423 RepID=UPI0025C9E398|nr:ATP-binding protein [Bacillus subtilis]GLI90548.1 hypothetical protein ANABIO4_39000 [Bacillus subtilis]